MSLIKTVYKSLDLLNPLYSSIKRNQLRVLAYHTVPDPDAFEKQLNYLRLKYSIISINDLRNHLFKGQALPEKAVLITFDDGDVSVKENGLPLLNKYRLPSVMFIITSLIDSKNMFWCRQVEHVLQEEGASYKEARVKVIELKNTANNKRVEYLNKMRKLESTQLSKDDLKEMEAADMFIGNHTHTHPMMDNCSRAEIKEELNNSKQCFEKWQINGYPVFAYPNGNWDSVSEKLLKQAGIKMAFLFDHKINSKVINPMRISRVRVDSDQPLEEFKVKVSGLHSLLMGYKQHIFNKQ